MPQQTSSKLYEEVNQSIARMIFILTFIFIVKSFISFHLSRKRMNRAESRVPALPPGPYGLPVLGYLPFLGKELHRELTYLASTYGPIYKLWLGSKQFVVISSPSIVREVLRDQDVVFANRSPIIGALVGTNAGQDIVFSNYDEGWRKRRKLFVSEMLSRSSLEDCYDQLNRQIKKMNQYLHGKNNEPVDVGFVASNIVNNTLMSVIWGDTLDGFMGSQGLNNNSNRSNQAEYHDLVRELTFLMGVPNISDLLPMLARFDLQGLERKIKHAASKLDQIFNLAIARCRRNIESESEDGERKSHRRSNFLQILLQLKEDKDTKTSLTLAEIKGMIMNILLGGSDTSSSTIVWAMAELLENPIAMSKAQQELITLIPPQNDVEFIPSCQRHLPYLNAIVKETFRLHPPAPFLAPHSPTTTTTLNGYTIPHNSSVLLNMYSIHRDPLIWNNPTRFLPERWLGDEAREVDWSGKWFQFLPFGSGRRMCPGIDVAERMVVTALAAMLYGREWRLPEGEKVDFDDEYAILIKKSKPLIAIPTLRVFKTELS
ncbi:Cytochrome P450 76C1-like protein [Drosera capensis]